MKRFGAAVTAVVLCAALCAAVVAGQHGDEHEFAHDAHAQAAHHEQWADAQHHSGGGEHEPVHEQVHEQTHDWSTVQHHDGHEPMHAGQFHETDTHIHNGEVHLNSDHHPSVHDVHGATAPVHVEAHDFHAQQQQQHGSSFVATDAHATAHGAAAVEHHDPLVHTVQVHSVMEPGNTVGVHRRNIDSPLEDIQWASEEVLFVLTEKGQVWRSHNSGADFVNVMPRLGSHGEPAVKSMYISAVDSNMIFMLGTGQVNWRSTDQGKTYHECDSLNLHDVRMHPTQKEWMLGAVMSAGCTQPAHETTGVEQHCFKQLYYTKDLCAHWHHMTDYVVQFDWSPPAGSPDHDGSRASDSLVYATVHSSKAGNQRFGFWDKDINFVQSYDFFAHAPTVMVAHGNRFLFGAQHSFLFVAAVNPLHESEVNLMISRDNDTHKLFQKAILPVDLTQHSYTILDTSEGSVFLHVNHMPFAESAQTGHVYISDWSGLVYSLSLPYNHRSGDGKCDFEKVEGLEGIYLANFIDEASQGEKTIDIEEAEEESSHASSESDKNSHHRRHRVMTKTVVTFDKGGLWSYLEPPSADSHGNPIQCAGTCHLHLHGVTDTFGPFYSTATATGLIMATGTVGSYLQADSEINTYLSRDAGLTWAEVRKGSHIYEFGDHGGLIVMADDNKLSNSILYSWDSGHTWTEVVIADQPFQIENIIIEPTATSQVFIVYGWHEGSGVLVHLNFAQLHTRDCKQPDQPGGEHSDYEHWSPGLPPHRCLMGHTVQYTRRKAGAACYNPDAYERVTRFENCACTAADFECDYGYERKESVSETGDKVLNGPCVPAAVPPNHADPTAVGPCKQYTRHTKGYRRVPGDTCVGGDADQYDALLMPCPSFLTSGGFGRFLLIVLVFVAFAACLAAASKKYGLMSYLPNVCQVQLRKWGVGAGKGPSYRPVGPDSATDPDDAQSYLNDEEFGRSAELMSDGAAPTATAAGKKAAATASASASASGASRSASTGGVADASHLLDAAVIDDSKTDIKPLPPARASESVPALAPPSADPANDDFNPRAKAN